MSRPGGSAGQASDTVRLTAARELVEQGESSLPHLIDMLCDPSWSVRRAVVSALASLGDSALPALTTCLQTMRDDEARIAATVDTLVSSSGSHVDEALIALLDASDPAVVADAVQILGRRRSRVANEALSRATQHSDDNVAVGAIEALGRLGGRAAVNALIACVQSDNFFRTFPAIDVLGRSGDPLAVEPLTALLRDNRYTLEAARALGRSGDRRAVAPLSALLASPSDSQVRIAAVALMDLCQRHAQLYGSDSLVASSLRATGSDAVVRRLEQSAAKADKVEKIAICRLLAALGREAALSLLLRLLDAEPEVAGAAGKAIVDIGAKSELLLSEALLQGESKRRAALLPIVCNLKSVPAVAVCLLDASPDVRVLACDALARLGAVTAVPALFDLLRDDSQRVVHAAVSAIQALGASETESLALAAAQANIPTVRRAGLSVLSYFGFPSALPVFEKVLAQNDARERDIALQGLTLLEQPEARALLLRIARDGSGSTKAGAMRALGQLSNEPSVIEPLVEGLSNGDPWVRYYACQSLGKLKAHQEHEAVCARLDDDAGHVRVAALEALSHFGTAPALARVRTFAQHADLDMRRAALVGLGLARDSESLQILISAATDSDPSTRLVALSSLAALPGDDVVEVLARASEDGSEVLRAAAMSLLSERPGRAAAEALVDLLARHGERDALMTALSAPREGRVPALLNKIEEADDDLSHLLMSCLARNGSPEAVAGAYQALASSNRAARKAAVATVSAFGSQEARTLLEQLSTRDSDPDVRRSCLLYLGQ